jgi:hypothetical protein
MPRLGRNEAFLPLIAISRFGNRSFKCATRVVFKNDCAREPRQTWSPWLQFSSGTIPQAFITSHVHTHPTLVLCITLSQKAR